MAYWRWLMRTPSSGARGNLKSIFAALLCFVVVESGGAFLAMGLAVDALEEMALTSAFGVGIDTVRPSRAIKLDFIEGIDGNFIVLKGDVTVNGI